MLPSYVMATAAVGAASPNTPTCWGPRPWSGPRANASSPTTTSAGTTGSTHLQVSSPLQHPAF